MSEMRLYYNQRAKEYEKVYQRPERQKELQSMGLQLQSKLKDHHVLEVACGTGYWTEIISDTAASILASDQSLETLEVARSKNLPDASVRFIQDDAYSLENSVGNFTAGFAGFWWSHVPKSRMREFLSKFNSKMPSGSKVIFIDNEFKEGNSSPLSKIDAEGNTYQNRTLHDGSIHEVLKNFPTDLEFKKALEGLGESIEITRTEHFWTLEYTTILIKQEKTNLDIK